MLRQITHEQVIQDALDSHKASLYVRMPGAVVQYYPADQTADVQPMINDVRLDLDTDGIVFEPWPVIHRVPVAWPRMGGITICGFLNPQDGVILEAFDLDPSKWIGGGRTGKPYSPADSRRLSGNYWSAHPIDLTGPIQSAPTSDGLVIGVDGALQQIVFSPTSITVGQAGCAVALSGGGAKVGRVGDSVSVTFTTGDAAKISAPSGGGACSAPSGSFTITGTITGGSPNVTSG